jgi:hypothetical protein
MLKAYTAFHSYSIGNQIAAIVQCGLRELPVGPINTYPGWQRLGRQVQTGQRAIELCMPLTWKPKAKDGQDDDDTPEYITTFVWKKNWFVLAQTEGQDVQPEPVPGWDKARALAALQIEEIPFEHTDGNCQGFARKRQVAINPLAALPVKTLFHELAHIELGHTTEGDVNDSEHTPRSLREAEAEATAMLLLDALGLPGSEYCRGYVQHWLAGAQIPEKSAQRIIGAADRILKAGQESRQSTRIN